MTKKVVAMHVQKRYYWEGIVFENEKFTPETWGENFDDIVATFIKNRDNVGGRKLDDKWNEAIEQLEEARACGDGETEVEPYKEYSSNRFEDDDITLSLEHEDGTYTHLDL